MAESKDNIITQGLRGSIGGQLVFKRYGNRTIVTKMPNMDNVVKSEKQKKENSKFSEAIAFAKSQMLDPESKAQYKAKARDLQKPHNVAIADFYNHPQIRNIDTSEIRNSKRLKIHAWDDFKIVNVKVEIFDLEGVILEQGEAVEQHEWFWEYRIIKDIPEEIRIVVHAWDKPAHKVSKEVKTF